MSIACVSQYSFSGSAIQVHSWVQDGGTAGKYNDSLRVENVMKQLVYAHGHRLAFLEEACVQELSSVCV